MELHSLKSASGARKNCKRVARGHGSGSGKTAGRGHKGQKSRAGYSQRPGFEGGQMPLHRRLPKRGFYHEKRHPFAEINLDVLEGAFQDGDVVTVERLREAGIIKTAKGGVKLLGRGEISKRLTLKVQAASASAQAKIEQVGGSVELIQMVAEKAPIDADGASE
jgi:large subunit ribosomal protein L15